MRKILAIGALGILIGAGAWLVQNPDPNGARVTANGTGVTANENGVEHNQLTLSLDRDGNVVLVEQGEAFDRRTPPHGTASSDGEFSVEHSPAHALRDAIRADDSAAVDTLQIDTYGGNDVLSIDNSNGLIPAIISFDGGEGFDGLALYGSTPANTTYSPGPGIDEGIVLQEYAGTTQRVDFSGLEPLQVLAPLGGNNVLNLGSAPLGVGFAAALNAPNSISMVEGPNSGDPIDPVFLGALTGFIAVDGFETLEFANFEVLNIDAGFGSDEVYLRNGVAPDELVTINVLLGDGDDILAVTPLVGVEIIAEGGDQALGDKLIVDAMGLPFMDTGTQILVSGFAPVSYSGFEKVGVDAGTCADDLSTCNDDLASCNAQVSDLEQQLADATADEDGDGLFDPFDRCPGTEAGRPIDDSGCSQKQFCAGIKSAYSLSQKCTPADWKNDEPVREPRDCRVKYGKCVATQS